LENHIHNMEHKWSQQSAGEIHKMGEGREGKKSQAAGCDTQKGRAPEKKMRLQG
jgi:hypothetical protein